MKILRYDVHTSNKKDIPNTNVDQNETQADNNNQQPQPRRGFASTSIGGIQFNPYVFREVIIAACDKLIGDSNPIDDFITIDIEEKNELNGLSEEFFNEFIATEVEPYLYLFDDFFQSRENEDLHSRVQKAVKVLNRTISIQRGEFTSFEALLDALSKGIIASDFERLSSKEDEVFSFICYLYVSCYIGKKTTMEDQHATATSAP